MLGSSTLVSNIREVDQDLYHDPFFSPNPEVSFLISINNNLDVDLDRFNQRAIDYFAHLIARFPLDLPTHIRRIHLFIKVGDRDGIYGALMDLFISLKQNGYKLRKRMLMVAQPILTIEQFDELFNCLKRGENIDPYSLNVATSVLSKGYIGDKNFIKKSSASTTETYDETSTIQQANDYLEYGQIDQARTLLEDAILKQPRNRKLHTNLLEIYWATRDIHRCQAMYGRLYDKHIPEHYIWKRTVKRIHNTIGVA